MWLGNEFHLSHCTAHTLHISLSCFIIAQWASLFFVSRSFESSIASFISFIRQEKNHSPLHLRNKWKAASQLNEAQQSLITCWCIWMRMRHPQLGCAHKHTHTHVSPGNKNTWLVNILDIKKTKQKAVFMNFRVGQRAGGQLHCNGISEFSDVMLSRVTWLTGWDRQMWNEADLEFMLSVAKGNSQYGGPAIGWIFYFV